MYTTGMKVAKVVMVAVIALAGALLAGCSGGGDQGRIAFTVSFENLPVLPPQGGIYEGWAVIGGIPFSTGKFRIDPTFSPALITNRQGTRTFGTTQSASFGPANTFLGQAFPFILDATSWFLTIEPEGDGFGLPTRNKILEGTITDGAAVLSTAGITSGDLATAAGSAFLVTPTDFTDADNNGLWFVSDAMGTPALSLPPLLGSWTWEGWVTDGTTTYSTGKFGSVDIPDLDAAVSPTRGDQSVGFAAPGQDFRNQATVGASTILDLDSGDWQVSLTVEPFPDNSTNPFPLLLSTTDIPTDAVNAEKVSVRSVEIVPNPVPFPAYDVVITPGTVALTASGLAPGLASLLSDRDGHYQLWAVLAGVEQPVVRFRIEVGTGQVSELATSAALGPTTSILLTTLNVPGLADLTSASEVFVTVEPQDDPVPEPSASVVLAGAITAGTGFIDVIGLTATGGRGIIDFTGFTGAFSLQTPTDNIPNAVSNAHQGLWFVNHEFFLVPTLFVPPFPGLRGLGHEHDDAGTGEPRQVRQLPELRLRRRHLGRPRLRQLRLPGSWSGLRHRPTRNSDPPARPQRRLHSHDQRGTLSRLITTAVHHGPVRSHPRRRLRGTPAAESDRRESSGAAVGLPVVLRVRGALPGLGIEGSRGPSARHHRRRRPSSLWGATDADDDGAPRAGGPVFGDRRPELSQATRLSGDSAGPISPCFSHQPVSSSQVLALARGKGPVGSIRVGRPSLHPENQNPEA